MTDNEVKWLIVGKLLRRNLMAGVKEEPVAYFYPSVVLPDIESVWTDKVTYPYACIYETSGDEPTTVLLMMTKPFIYKREYSEYIIVNGKPVQLVCTDCYLIGNGTQVVTYLLDTASNEFTFVSATTIDRSAQGHDGALAFAETRSNVQTSYGGSKVLWTNADMVREDGSVYLTATTPVPAGNGMVAYKKVKLPKLPDVDKEKYPYMCVERQRIDGISYGFLLRCTASPVIVTSSGFALVAPRCSFVNRTKEWVFSSDSNSNYVVPFDMSSVVWANHDVYNEDGSVYLAATEPIPIYEL